jgi:hypothetical protein
MAIDLTAPASHDEERARRHMEVIRWPNGPFCPHCGSVDGITACKARHSHSELSGVIQRPTRDCDNSDSEHDSSRYWDSNSSGCFEAISSIDAYPLSVYYRNTDA